MKHRKWGMAALGLGGVALAVYAGLEVFTARPQGSVPVPSIAPAQPAPSIRNAEVVELTAANSGREILVTADSWLETRLRVPRLARRTYVIEVQTPQYAPNRSDAKAVNLVAATEGQGCAPEVVASLQALEASEVDASLASLISQARALVEKPGCVRGADVIRGLLGQLVWQNTPVSIKAQPNIKTSIAVQEYDAQGSPTRRWNWTVVGRVEGFGTAATEEEWIIRTVASAMTDMAQAVGNQKQAVPIEVAHLETGYRVTVGERTWPIDLRAGSSIWDPTIYVPMAREFVTSFPPGERVTKDAGVAKSLLTPTSETLVRVSNQVTQSLLANPRSASVHESAALTLGAFLSKDGLDELLDQREGLSKMTAHLAMAAALSPAPANRIEARLALALLDIHSGRERRAMTSLLELMKAPSLGATAGAWTRALAMKASMDWRLLRNPGQATLLERIEYVGARARTMGGDQTVDDLETVGPEELSDWPRLILPFSPSVEVENTLVGRNVSLLEAEILALRALLMGAPKAAEAAPEALLAMCATEPSGWKLLTPCMWARQRERRLLSAARQHILSRRFSMGLPEEAAQLESAYMERYSRLPLLPAIDVSLRRESLLQQINDPKDDKKSCAAMVTLVMPTPHRIPYSLWAQAFAQCPERVTGKLRDPRDWHQPFLPRGTSYDATNRVQDSGISQMPPGTASELDAALSMRYYDQALLRALTRVTANRGPASRDFARFKDQDGYNSTMLLHQTIGMAGPPQERLAPGRKMCDLTPHRCHRYATLARSLGQTDEAVRAMERALQSGKNQVDLSPDLGWLIDEYVARGAIKDATRVAEIGGRTGSAAGLFDAARLQERLQNYQAALLGYQVVDEGYSLSVTDFLLFRLSLRGRATEIDPAVVQAGVHRLFPKGLIKEADRCPAAKPTHGTTPPTAWQFLVDTPEHQRELQAMGLSATEAIVAVNGIAVETLDQVKAAFSTNDPPIQPEVRVLEATTGVCRTIPVTWTRAHYGPVKNSRPRKPTTISE